MLRLTPADGEKAMERPMPSMRAAATAVANHRTGWAEWDLRPPDFDDPADLNDWTRDVPT